MKSYITIYESVGGWKAVEVWWNTEDGGFWEPYQTGICGYATPEEAISEAEMWAADEHLEFRRPK